MKILYAIFGVLSGFAALFAVYLILPHEPIMVWAIVAMVSGAIHLIAIGFHRPRQTPLVGFSAGVTKGALLLLVEHFLPETVEAEFLPYLTGGVGLLLGLSMWWAHAHHQRSASSE